MTEEELEEIADYFSSGRDVEYYDFLAIASGSRKEKGLWDRRSPSPNRDSRPRQRIYMRVLEKHQCAPEAAQSLRESWRRGKWVV